MDVLLWLLVLVGGFIGFFAFCAFLGFFLPRHPSLADEEEDDETY